MEKYLKDQPFEEESVANLQNNICEKVLTILLQQNANYKYMSKCPETLLPP